LALPYVGTAKDPAIIVGSGISGNQAIGANVIMGGAPTDTIAAGGALGGGIYFGSGSLVVKGSSVKGNTAKGGDGDPAGTASNNTSPGSASGGGIHNEGPELDLTLQGTEVARNKAIAGTAGSDFGPRYGGAIGGGVKGPAKKNGANLHHNYDVVGNTQTLDNHTV
jgi:hypothetical protein